ncbi:MAG: hypothetical protein JW795_06275 [Chitinivibrionales bacterium]|nr:hypothetical protein [Chitinivibrionales bacterium]
MSLLRGTDTKNFLSQPTSPLDYAITFAIPWTQDEFAHQRFGGWPKDLSSYQYNGGKERDFVFQLIKKWGTNISEEALWQRYVELLEIAEQLISCCIESGVEVVRAASIKTIQELLVKKKVLTLFAHWKYCDYSNTQPSFSLQEILELILCSRESTINKIRNYLGEETIEEYFAQLSEPSSDNASAEMHFGKIIVTKLNDILSTLDFNLTGKKEPEYVFIDSNNRVHLLSRDIQHAWFNGLYDDGGKIELADGMHHREAFLSAIPERFEGLIDLAVCNSRHLAEHIKRHRKCYVVMANDTVKIKHRLIIQKEVVRMLQKKMYSYADILITINKKLREL